MSWNNFYVKQITQNTNRAREELRKLLRFRFLSAKLKVRLYKALILPLLTYPAVPLNISSATQIKRLQVIQNKAIRWITGEYWPIICPLALRHEELKIEKMDERLNRLAENVWIRTIVEDGGFFQETSNIQTYQNHSWFPSSYDKVIG